MCISLLPIQGCVSVTWPSAQAREPIHTKSQRALIAATMRSRASVAELMQGANPPSSPTLVASYEHAHSFSAPAQASTAPILQAFGSTTDAIPPLVPTLIGFCNTCKPASGM